MRVNYHRSELVSISIANAEEIQGFAEDFGCHVGLSHTKEYLFTITS
jgi:hypothetical protein